jgi:formyl-CoA transferase
VLGDASLGTDEKFATNPKRNENRAETDGIVARVFAQHDVEPLIARLADADIAFARVNDSALLANHPHLRRITIETPTGPVHLPAPAPQRAEEPRTYGPVPALGAHTELVRKEFRPARA